MELAFGVIVAIFVTFVLLAWLVESENTIAHLVVGIVIAVLFWQKVFSFEPIAANPGKYILFALAWIVTGLAWSFPRWHIQVARWKNSCVEAIENSKRRFLKSRGISYDDLADNVTIPTDLVAAYQEDNRYTSMPEVPNIRTDYPIVISWVTYWPASMGAWLVRSPIRRLVKLIFVQWLGRYFSNISRRAAADVASRMPSKA
jgi:hypothetical protein